MESTKRHHQCCYTSQAKFENIGGRFYKKSKKYLNDQSCKLISNRKNLNIHPWLTQYNYLNHRFCI